MKDYSGCSAPFPLSISRFASDKVSSDSGISSRGGSSSSSGSSDERSGSRSSTLSSLDENLPSSQQQLLQQQQQQQHKSYLHPQQSQYHVGRASPVRDHSPTAVGFSGGPSVAAADRFYLHHPASQAPAASAPPTSGHHLVSALPLDAVRVWRDHPSLPLSLIGDPAIHRVDSIQHQSLLMSHPAVGVGSPSSASSVAAVSPPSVAAAPSTPSVHYPPASAISSMITPPPLQHQLPPHSLYSPMPEMLWKPPRFTGLSMTPAHLHSMPDDNMLERAYVHDRDRQERQDRQIREQEREIEKQKEREKLEREKQEKDRLEKQRAAQAVHEHFRKTQTLGYKKSNCWNFRPASSAPSSNPSRINEEERQRIEQDQQRMIRSDLRELEKPSGLPAFASYAHNLQMTKSTTAAPMPSNPTSTPPNSGAASSTTAVIQNRVKSQISLPKAESMYGNMYGYPAFSQPISFLASDKLKLEQMKNSVAVNSIVPNKSSSAIDREREQRELLIATGMQLSHVVQPLDMKNSVIVKNDGKNLSRTPPPHMLPADVLKSGGGSVVSGIPATTTVIPSHSPSPKLRISDAAPHYLQPPSSAVKSYEYRSPSQSPLQAAHISNATSPHQLHMDAAKMHHRTSSSPASASSTSTHHRQSPLPLTHSRQSPQTHHRQSPQMHHRQSPLPATQPPIQLSSHSRHSPHSSSTSSRTSSPPDQRYVTAVSPNTGGTYPKGPPAPLTHSSAGGMSGTAYAFPSSLSCVTAVSTPIKPKVSSPAPLQMYGKPTSGISTGTPVCRSQEISISSVPPLSSKVLITPSPYQQLSHLQPPPSTTVSTTQNMAPPPAHSSRISSVVSDPHLFYSGTSSAASAQRQSAAADLTSSGIGVSMSSSVLTTTFNSSSVSSATIVTAPASTAPSVALSAQVQPLDLGVKECNDQSVAPAAELTKRKLDESEPSDDQPATKRINSETADPALSAVDAPLSLSVCTTVPTPLPAPALAPVTDDEVNGEMSSGISSSADTTPPNGSSIIRIAVGTPPPPTLTPTLSGEENLTAALPIPCSSPSTPAKLAPSSIDGEKSNSPKPPSYGGHKLKKAWLQRHSGEDVWDEKSSNSGGGSSSTTCVASSAVKSLDGSLSINESDGNVPTNGGNGNSADRGVNGDRSSPLLPTTTTTTVTKDTETASSNALTSLNNSLNSIGSMAVNSISKVRQPKGGGKRSAGGKDSRMSPLVPNGHLSPKVSGTNSDESSSTDTETKSPKRVPPKLKRKKHLTPRKTQTGAAAAATTATSTTTAATAAGGSNAGSGSGVSGGSVAEDAPKRKKLNSTSSTDSDKESASEKDSDNSSSKKVISGCGGNGSSGGGDDKKDNSRKRGRKPKTPPDGYSAAGAGGVGAGSAGGGSGGGGGGGASGGGSSGGGSSSNGNSNGNGKDSNSSDGPPDRKKMREEPREQKDPFPKPPISQLKKTGESFLQDGPCFEVAPKLAKCRECRWTQNQRSKSNSNIFCRFYAFRRLRYTKNGQLAIAGFSDPYRDAKQDDLNLWLPNAKNPPNDLDLEVARFTLVQVGDQFCDLLMQEADAININLSEDKKIAWKRVVQGVREMCDVCETTLFNFHWACSKCGFVVCIDCYKGRKNGTIKIWGECGKDRDDMSWLLCTNRQPHEQEKLMLTQIIAGDSLMKLLKLSHETRAMWDIPLHCGCPLAANPKPTNEICKAIMRNLKQEKQKKAEQVNGQVKTENGSEEAKRNENDSPLTWLADVALNQNKTSADDDCDSSDDSEDGSFSTLRELLIRPTNKANGNGSQPSSPNSSAPAATSTATSPAASSSTTTSTSISTSVTSAASKAKPKKSVLENFNEMLSNVGECNDDNADDFINHGFGNNSSGVELKYFVRGHMKQHRDGGQLPIRIMTLSDSKLLYPDVPHAWLCEGKLLRLLDAMHPGNYTIFQDQWRRGQPVIVSEVNKRLNPELWHPDSFIKDFGDVKNDLINCMTGNIVPNQQMRKFWEGFEYLSRRLKDDKGNDMLLKLKDWPPGEDFAEMLPSRYNDLMNVLPLGEYTQRSGRLNLASRLPECFVRPDLGPKMYNAYGSAMYPNKGTTNLHLDISDAVNVMVYVGIPKDGENEAHIKEAYRAIDEAGCDILTRRRVREKGELPGALWHIYAARDADKIRDLLNKVAIERGSRLEPNHDPIHDQSCYLDGPLRERLSKEYSVEGYTIVQCMGDAVFVPAGAPHQVRNLHNCIKVAEDFVSPENVSQCFHLTQEFRDLSDTHSNHEDKLQIKNIMYHAVKDSLSVMGAALQKNSQKSGDESGAAAAAADVKPVKVEPKSDS